MTYKKSILNVWNDKVEVIHDYIQHEFLAPTAGIISQCHQRVGNEMGTVSHSCRHISLSACFQIGSDEFLSNQAVPPNLKSIRSVHAAPEWSWKCGGRYCIV